MTFYYNFRSFYLSNYLLSIAVSILLLTELGSVNIMLICMGDFHATFMLEMILVTLASMAFLFVALAQFKPNSVFNVFFWGMLFQLGFLIFKIQLTF